MTNGTSCLGSSGLFPHKNVQDKIGQLCFRISDGLCQGNCSQDPCSSLKCCKWTKWCPPLELHPKKCYSYNFTSQTSIGRTEGHFSFYFPFSLEPPFSSHRLFVRVLWLPGTNIWGSSMGCSEIGKVGLSCSMSLALLFVLWILVF